MTLKTTSKFVEEGGKRAVVARAWFHIRARRRNFTCRRYHCLVTSGGASPAHAAAGFADAAGVIGEGLVGSGGEGGCLRR